MKLRPILVATAIAALVVLPTSALATDANGNHEKYTWVVGATTPTDTAIAPDDSTITMSGRGTLEAGPANSATGGGTFSMSSGAQGTWTATGVLGFVSYGAAGPGFPAGFTGGEAKLAITLSNGASGVLTIVCVLGKPPDGKDEGISVILGSGGNFTKHDGGNTIFILVS